MCFSFFFSPGLVLFGSPGLFPNFFTSLVHGIGKPQ